MPTPTPAPTPAATPLAPLAGTWAGIIDVQDDPANPRRRVTLSLHDCSPASDATVAEQCGLLEVRRVDGLGCVYGVEYRSATANELVDLVINTGPIDCEDTAWPFADLSIRPAAGGSIAVSRVREPGGPDLRFTLRPAPPPQPALEPSVTADRTTTRAGQKITITFAGFAAGSGVSITLERPYVPLGRSHLGAATVVVRIPPDTPAGRNTIWVEGSDLDSRETGVGIPVTVVR